MSYRETSRIVIRVVGFRGGNRRVIRRNYIAICESELSCLVTEAVRKAFPLVT